MLSGALGLPLADDRARTAPARDTSRMEPDATANGEPLDGARTTGRRPTDHRAGHPASPPVGPPTGPRAGPPAGGGASEHEVLRTALDWLLAGHRVDLVTVARTWGSSPRPPGSIAAVRGDGHLVGSVSGGCVETRLVADLAAAEAGGRSPVAAHLVADEEARRVGLTCGGRIELVFERLSAPAAIAPILSALEERRRVVRRLDVDARRATLAEAAPEDGFGWDGRTLTRVYGPTWRVLLIGAGELSRYVASFAIALDFEVFVCDPRAPFRETFDLAGVTLLDLLPDEAVERYAGDERSAVLTLSHDPTLDDLALEEALSRDSFHIAALGSRRSHAARLKRLAFLGVTDAAAARVNAPAGLAIGSRTAAEIGISIAAELVQARGGARMQARHPAVERTPPDA